MSHYRHPFKSPACEDLGYGGGNVGSVSGQSCVGEDGKSFFQIDFYLLYHYSHDPFKSLACIGLGQNGDVGSVSGQSCNGLFGKSLFQMLI